MKYEVLCDNIGLVHQGDDLTEARQVYNQYVVKSKEGEGRAAGEDVTLLEDGEPIAHHLSGLEDMQILP
jgi:hypothetical protein